MYKGRLGWAGWGREGKEGGWAVKEAGEAGFRVREERQRCEMQERAGIPWGVVGGEEINIFY
eukprot:scaffold63052_cov32-Tisochrysis_lutea.AAC.4